MTKAGWVIVTQREEIQGLEQKMARYDNRNK